MVRAAAGQVGAGEGLAGGAGRAAAGAPGAAATAGGGGRAPAAAADGAEAGDDAEEEARVSAVPATDGGAQDTGAGASVPPGVSSRAAAAAGHRWGVCGWQCRRSSGATAAAASSFHAADAGGEWVPYNGGLWAAAATSYGRGSSNAATAAATPDGEYK